MLGIRDLKQYDNYNYAELKMEYEFVLITLDGLRKILEEFKVKEKKYNDRMILENHTPSEFNYFRKTIMRYESLIDIVNKRNAYISKKMIEFEREKENQ